MLIDPCCNITANANCYNYTHYLKNISVLTQVTGVLMFIGTSISVVPQIIKFYKRKSTDGVSLTMLVMALYNNWNALESTFMSQFSRFMACFQTLKCWASFLSCFQQFASFIGYYIAYIQYLYYQNAEVKKQNDKQQLKYHKYNIIIFIVSSCYALITIPAGIAPGLYFGPCDSVYQIFVLIYNVSAAIVSCAEWVPQIIKTFKQKSCGSFSILGMAVQAPGLAITLVVMIATGTKWTVWIATSVSVVLHFILLGQLIYYYFIYQGGEHKKLKYQKLLEQEQLQEEQKLLSDKTSSVLE